MAQQQQYDEFGNPVLTNQNDNSGVANPAPAAAPQKSPWDRTAFRDEINGAPDAYAVLDKYGLTADKSGRVTLPSGEIMDVVREAGAGGRTGQWMGVGEVHNGQASMYSGGPAPAPQAGGVGGAGNTSGGPQWDALYAQLMARAQQGLDVNANDPAVKGQTDAFSAQQQRSRRDFLADQAEGSSNFATGAQLGQARMTAEKLGQNVGGFQAELMGREISARREEIQNALTQMGGMLSDQQRLALQRELGLLDANLRQQTINNQAGQSQRDYDFNANDRATYWDWLKQGGKI